MMTAVSTVKMEYKIMNDAAWLKIVLRCSQIYTENKEINDVENFVKWLYKQYGVEYKPPIP